MTDNDSDKEESILLLFVIVLVSYVIYSSIDEQINFISNIRINLFLSGIYVSIGEIVLILLFLFVSIVAYLIIFPGLQLDHLRFRYKHPQASITGIIKAIYNRPIEKLKREK